MTAPEPADIDRACVAIARQLTGLADGYRWLHPAVYSQPGTGGGTGGGGHTGGDVHDLAAILASNATLRRHLEQAGAAVLHAERCIAGAVKELDRAERHIDQHRPDPPDPIAEKGLPRTVTRNELKAARRAQARRLGRGESWGVG